MSYVTVSKNASVVGLICVSSRLSPRPQDDLSRNASVAGAGSGGWGERGPSSWRESKPSVTARVTTVHLNVHVVLNTGVNSSPRLNYLPVIVSSVFSAVHASRRRTCCPQTVLPRSVRVERKATSPGDEHQTLLDNNVSGLNHTYITLTLERVT